MLKAYWPSQLPTPGFYFRGVADTHGWPFKPPTSSTPSLHTYLDGARNVGRYGRERSITDLQLNSFYTRHPLERPNWPYVFCISELTLDASQPENPIPIPIHTHLLPGGLQNDWPRAWQKRCDGSSLFRLSTLSLSTKSKIDLDGANSNRKSSQFSWPDDHKSQQSTEERTRSRAVAKV